ncbi:MAG: hypothetical protein DRI90_04585 [Deltaproteobacteria bacterium]|nr:MAG: hypothetical protein DRI90_04585 [Deltaproteobacteria bacterium]
MTSRIQPSHVAYLAVKTATRGLAIVCCSIMIALPGMIVLRALSVFSPAFVKYWQEILLFSLVGIFVALACCVVLLDHLILRMPLHTAEMTECEAGRDTRVRFTCILQEEHQRERLVTFTADVPPVHAPLVQAGRMLALRCSPDRLKFRIDWDETRDRYAQAASPGDASGQAVPRVVACPQCGATLDENANPSGRVQCPYCRSTVALRS